MFDRIFSATLAFAVLAAGTIAIGAAMLEGAPAPVVQLPRVEVTGQRAMPPTNALAQVRQADPRTCSDSAALRT
jgi:hypothetical protein